MSNYSEELTNLLNPENLTEQSLISILRQRMVVIDDVDNITKDALVDLFHRTVTPLPQRVMRKNRLGKLLKCRQEKYTKLKPKPVDAPNLLTAAKEVPSKPHCSSQKGGLVMSANVPSSPGFRLKPPPIVLKKNSIVKLKRTSESNKDNKNVNGKIIKTKSPSPLSPSPTGTSKKVNTKLPVKRPSQQTEQNAIDESSPKKKIKKITWP